MQNLCVSKEPKVARPKIQTWCLLTYHLNWLYFEERNHYPMNYPKGDTHKWAVRLVPR